MPRSATIVRKTRETDLTATWDLDAPAAGVGGIATGIGFLDHMLEALARHSGTSIRLSCTGDLHIDGHHTTEDCGLVLGQCLRQALGDRAGIERFGSISCPLDEALVAAAIDISGRGWLTYELAPPAAAIGGLATELVPEFFAALADQACITVHLHQVCGRNSHHLVEAAFKAFARALRQAIRVSGGGVPSTKGMLA